MDTSTLSRPSGPPAPREAHALPADPTRRSPGVPDRFARLWRGRDDDPAWARPALLGLLLTTAVLYLWGLGASGWANSFYSAAVQAGSESWKAFFFGSSDAASSITVDKTPLSLWPMALSVRLFGLSSWSILVPQALMGVATVGLLHHLVRRTTGSAAAGLVAGAAMALTPVAVLMFRFNNPDALLTLLMVGAAAATLRGIEASGEEHGHPVRWLSLGGALVGLAFLTKMLQAFLVLPALALAYLLFAQTPWGKRVGHLLVAFGSMVLAGGWWIAIVELWPAASRPWIGGSQDNSILELTLGYNGLGRLNGEETGSVGGGARWRRLGRDRPVPPVQQRDRRTDRVAAPGGPGARRRRALVRPPRQPGAVGADAVAHLARRHRADLQPDGRHLPRLLHRRPRPGGRCPGRHRVVGALAPP